MTRWRSSAPPAGLTVLTLATLAALTGCSGPSGPGSSSSTPSATSPPAGSSSAASSSGTAFEARLTTMLEPPALPSFTIPTDLLDSRADQDIAQKLRVQPGLYQGIAVLSERCTNGSGHSADAGAISITGGGSYKKGDVEVTVKGDGTGVYNAPGIHVAVLPDGSGVFEQGPQRLSVEPDGSGTWVNGAVRLTVRADGSGAYSGADARFWVGPDGSGGYSDDRIRVSVTSSGSVGGTASPGEQAVVKRLVGTRLQRFPPVPAVRRVKPTGTVCGTVIRLDANALFDFGSAELRPDARALVDRVAALLTALRPKTIQVNGYTDHIGSTEDNVRLSKQRAGGVAAELSARGILAGSMDIRGLGEADPIRPETTSSGADDPGARQLDRRVEIVLPS